MRITIVQGPFLPVPPLRGGAVEKAWFTLGRDFARRGHVVTHISRRFPDLPNEEVIEGVHHIRVRGFDAPRAWRPLRGIDLIWPLRLLLDFLFARRARRQLPDADILVTNTFWLPMLVPRSSACGRLFVHVGRFPRAQVRFYRHAARLQAPSSAVAAELRKRLPDSANRICTIPYPLADDMKLGSAEEFAAAGARRERRIVFAGRVHPQKGLGTLIDAFARFASSPGGEGWRLEIIGSADAALGGGGGDFLRLLQARGGAARGRIEWTGFVADPRELRQHLVHAGVFVYPSIDEAGETFGVAALEAMGCGCPVIVSNLACFRDFVRNGESGFLFDHCAADAAGQLADLFAHLGANADLRRDVGKRGWAATENFRHEAVTTQFLAEFEATLSDS